MAYQIDYATGDLVISGFGNGIGGDPYSGLTDEKNVNIISVPNEASVNFKTSNIASGAISGTVNSVSSNVLTATITGTMENYIAIYFTSLGSYSGISLHTPYWVGNLSGSTFKIYSDYEQSSVVSVTGSGSAAFVAYQMGIPPPYVTGAAGGPIKYFAEPLNTTTSTYFTFGVDGSGLVWGNFKVTGTNSFWTYTGNYISDGTGGSGDQGVSNASGNGLAYWTVNNGALGTSLKTDAYLFVIRNSQLDFFVVLSASGNGTVGTWHYGWNPSNGMIGGVNSPVLATGAAINNSHATLIGYDNRFYFCDSDNIQKIYQTATGTIFNPFSGDTTTHTFLTFPLLPISDIAQCLAPSGTNILIGGQGYNAYNWNTTASLVSNYIPLAEPFISSIITVNVNSYIFTGNRGRIYITNGSQANLFAKIPDHLSGTVEPRFIWGGTAASRDQLYFSFQTFTNSGNPVTMMGGLWAIDLNTNAIRLTNQLSYGTYAGYASALIGQIFNPVQSVAPTGTSLFAGWYDGVSSYGVDIPSTSLYTGGQSTVVSELIPIGTLLRKQTALQLEYKLSVPLQTGESVQVLIGSSLADYLNSTMTSVFTTNGDGTGTILSDNSSNHSGITVQSQQWLIVQAILTGGSSSTPSFNRLVQLRVIGDTLKTQIAGQPFATA
jgi:hypothetical protein